MADIFEELAEAVEVDRLNSEVQIRTDALKDARNKELVTLGQTAITSGGWTRNNIAERTWAAVSRQRVMMQHLGFAVIGPELRQPGRGDIFRIRTRVVRVAGDIGVALCQQTRSQLDSKGFWKLFETEGMESALDRYAKPRTTGATVYDLRTQQPVHTILLNPDSSSSPDRDFWEEWGRSLLPFRGAQFESPAMLDESRNTHDSYPLSENDLIIACGMNIRFNNLLDEVEVNL